MISTAGIRPSRWGGDRLGYVAPKGQTVVTTDPVAVLRGTDRRELAVRFVRFLLTRRGQAVWNFPVGAEVAGLRGPERFALGRSPIRRDMYEQFREHMIDRANPFQIASKLPEGTASYFSVLPTVLHAMAIDVHQELQAAWAAIRRTGDP